MLNVSSVCQRASNQPIQTPILARDCMLHFQMKAVSLRIEMRSRVIFKLACSLWTMASVLDCYFSGCSKYYFQRWNAGQHQLRLRTPTQPRFPYLPNSFPKPHDIPLHQTPAQLIYRRRKKCQQCEVRRNEVVCERCPWARR